MAKKNALERNTTHFDGLTLIKGKPKNGKMHFKRQKRRGPSRRK